MEFSGAKVALVYGDKLVMQLRDDKPSIPFPNMWDFAGGGRENSETPIETVIRETQEELSITLNKDAFVWEKVYPQMNNPDKLGYFFVASVSKEDVDTIVFGDEGQRWELMDIDTFFDHPDVVPKLKDRFRDYLNALK